MAEPNTPPANTDPITPPVDPGTPPAPAPVEPSNPAPAPNPAEPVVPKKPVQKLQSERDKLQNEVQQMRDFLEPIAIERTVDAFLSENKDKFPDLTRDDFIDVPDISPEFLTQYATRLQTRLQDHAQKKILDIESPQVPVLSLEDQNAELEQMRSKKDPNTFQRFLAHRTSARPAAR